MKTIEQEETIVPGIPFPWPMEEGHSAFVMETESPHSRYSSGDWQHGINIGNHPAPTEDDICNGCLGTRRNAIVEVYKFRVNSRGKRTGMTIKSREFFFDENDKLLPSGMTIFLLEAVERYTLGHNWRRVC